MPKNLPVGTESDFDPLLRIVVVARNDRYDRGKRLREGHVITIPLALRMTAEYNGLTRDQFGRVMTRAEVIAPPRPALLNRTSPGGITGSVMATIVPLTGTIGMPEPLTREKVTGGVVAIKSAEKKKGADEMTGHEVIVVLADTHPQTSATGRGAMMLVEVLVAGMSLTATQIER